MHTRTTNRTKEAARRAAPGNEELRNRSLPIGQVLVGDALERLQELPSASVDTVVTSPPYFRLRNYQIEGQLGLEATVGEWVQNLAAVLAEVARVLKPGGTLWLNLGDTYSRSPRHGAPAKSLLLAPEKLLLTLERSGWLVRNKVIWAKANGLPTPVRDRLATTWEPLYLLTRSPHYYFDLDAIRVPATSKLNRPAATSPAAKYTTTDGKRPAWSGPAAGINNGLAAMKAKGLTAHPLGKNPGDLWTLPTAAYRGAHFATFPEALVERPLQAACPERVCASCGTAWQRTKTAASLGTLAILGQLRKSCPCLKRSWHPGVVLDPFIGAGTVGVVATKLHRHWLGIELNPNYAQLARERIGQVEGARS